MTFGKKLATLRKQANITQEDLAAVLCARYKDCSINRYQIARWETDRDIPYMVNAKFIARYFKTTLDELFFDNKKITVQTQTNRMAYA